MNEVTLHRGRNPHLTVVDAFFDGEHLTEAVVGQSTTNANSSDFRIYHGIDESDPNS